MMAWVASETNPAQRPRTTRHANSWIPLFAFPEQLGDLPLKISDLGDWSVTWTGLGGLRLQLLQP